MSLTYYITRSMLAEPRKTAVKVLTWVDSYIELTGKTKGALTIRPQHYDLINKSLLKGSDNTVTLGNSTYRGLTLRRQITRRGW